MVLAGLEKVDRPPRKTQLCKVSLFIAPKPRTTSVENKICYLSDKMTRQNQGFWISTATYIYIFEGASNESALLANCGGSNVAIVAAWCSWRDKLIAWTLIRDWQVPLCFRKEMLCSCWFVIILGHYRQVWPFVRIKRQRGWWEVCNSSIRWSKRQRYATDKKKCSITQVWDKTGWQENNVIM